MPMAAVALCALFSGFSARAADVPAYDAVSPFVGTGADGNTFPGATLPLGMMQWGPDTRDDGW